MEKHSQRELMVKKKNRKEKKKFMKMASSQENVLASQKLLYENFTSVYERICDAQHSSVLVH